MRTWCVGVGVDVGVVPGLLHIDLATGARRRNVVTGGAHTHGIWGNVAYVRWADAPRLKRATERIGYAN